MKKNDWVQERLAFLLILMSGVLGIVIVTQMGSLATPIVLYFFATMLGLVLLPLAIKSLRPNTQKIILTAALFVTPILLMGTGYFLQHGFSLSGPAFYWRGTPITVMQIMLTLVVLVSWILAVEFYVRNRKK